MLDYVLFQDIDVRYSTPGHLTVQPSRCRVYYFNWVFADERLHGNIRDEHSVVSNSIAEWHNTSVSNLNIDCHPQSVDWLTSLEEGGASPLACV